MAQARLRGNYVRLQMRRRDAHLPFVKLAAAVTAPLLRSHDSEPMWQSAAEALMALAREPGDPDHAQAVVPDMLAAAAVSFGALVPLLSSADPSHWDMAAYLTKRGLARAAHWGHVAAHEAAVAYLKESAEHAEATATAAAAAKAFLADAAEAAAIEAAAAAEAAAAEAAAAAAEASGEKPKKGAAKKKPPPKKKPAPKKAAPAKKAPPKKAGKPSKDLDAALAEIGAALAAVADDPTDISRLEAGMAAAAAAGGVAEDLPALADFERQYASAKKAHAALVARDPARFTDPNRGPTTELWRPLLDVAASCPKTVGHKLAPLIAAQIGGSLECIDALLAGGADPNCADSFGQTAIMHALARGDAGAVERMIAAAKIDVDAVAAAGFNVLKLSFLAPVVDAAAAAALAAKGKPVPSDARLAAAVLARGADPNVADDAGNFALHWATAGASVLFSTTTAVLSLGAPAASADRAADLVEKLLRAGARAAVVNLRGVTPLHEAAGRGFEHAAGLLLGAGANPNAADDLGMLPLHYACAGAAPGAAPVVTLLLHRGTGAPIAEGAHDNRRRGRPALDKRVLSLIDALDGALGEALVPAPISKVNADLVRVLTHKSHQQFAALHYACGAAAPDGTVPAQVAGYDAAARRLPIINALLDCPECVERRLLLPSPVSVAAATATLLLLRTITTAS